MAELEAAHAKAMEDTQHLRSPTNGDIVPEDSTAHMTQALPQAVHLDIAPMVQRTDISRMRSSDPVPGQPGTLSISSQVGDERASASTRRDGVPQCMPAGRARRSSIFQQTATGIKTMLQLATNTNQVAPALFEEVRLIPPLHVMFHCQSGVCFSLEFCTCLRDTHNPSLWFEPLYCRIFLPGRRLAACQLPSGEGMDWFGQVVEIW